jgi:saccharopine dehydrogenase-like NADP-dependent oxidoreductase
MQVVIEGSEHGNRVCYTYNLYDEYDRETKTLSMSRTTGYAATGAAALILNGKLGGPGVMPSERVAEKEECFRDLLTHLSERGVQYEKERTPLQ